MLFLIEYDRSASKTVHYRQYRESDRSAAESARLQRELAVNRAKVNHEVVLLQAPSVEALRLTHARYFDDIERMLSRIERTAAAGLEKKR